MSAFCAVVAIAALVGSHPSTAHSGDRVLYVGDSLGLGTVQALRASATLGGALEADTRVGRSSTEALAVLRSKLRRQHKLVVFDVGTNDGSSKLLRRNLVKARALARRRPLIVFTLNKPNVRPFNGVIEAFARTTENVSLIDWHTTATSRHLLAADGVHPDVAGYRRRAALAASAISRTRRASWRRTTSP